MLPPLRDSKTHLDLDGTRSLPLAPLISDVQDVIFLADAFKSREDASLHFGLCVGGLCLARLSAVIRAHLANSLSTSHVGLLHEDHRTFNELSLLLQRIIQTVLGSGEQGLLCLSLLMMHPAHMTRLTTLVRIQFGHPSRAMVLEHEGDEIGSRGRMWTRSSKGQKFPFVAACDAILCAMVVQLTNRNANLDETIVRYPPSVTLNEVKRKQRGLPPEGYDLERPWVEGTMLAELMVQVAWRCLDKNHNGKFEMEEAREMLRIILSRPLLCLVALPKVMASTPHSEEYLEELPESWHTAMALRAITMAILYLATKAGEVAKTFWEGLDHDSNGAVNNAEFEALFVRSLEDNIVQPLVDAAVASYQTVLHQACGIDTSRCFRKAGEKMQEQPSSRLRQEQPSSVRHDHEVPMPTASSKEDDKSAQPTVSPRHPAPCSMEWLMGWMAKKKRDCSA